MGNPGWLLNPPKGQDALQDLGEKESFSGKSYGGCRAKAITNGSGRS